MGWISVDAVEVKIICVININIRVATPMISGIADISESISVKIKIPATGN